MVKNFVKQIIRTPIKTIVFTILIAIVCVLLAVGSLMYVCSDNELKSAKNNFIAEVNVENLEDINNPYSAVNNNLNINELSPLINSKLIGNKSIQKRLAGHGENFTAFHDTLCMLIYDVYPYATFDIEIISSEFLKEQNSQIYTAKVLEVLSGFEDLKEITIVQNSDEFDLTNDKLEVGKRYVINCKFFDKMWEHEGYNYMTGNNETIEAYAIYYMISLSNKQDGDIAYKYYEVKDDNYKNNIDFKPYQEFSNAFTISDKEVNVWYSNSMFDFKSIHSRKTPITSGREITQEEFDTGAKVCLVSQSLCSKNSLSLGRTIQFKVRPNENNFVEYADFPSTLDEAQHKKYDDTEIQEYEIVGIYKSDGIWGNYKYIDYPENIIYVPEKTFPSKFIKDVDYKNISSNQISLSLKNCNDKNKLIQEIKDKGLNTNKYSIIIKTQGADEVNSTFKEMKQTSFIMLISCLIVAIIIIFFIVFIYINKRKVDAAIMVAFGTKRRKIIAGFLVSIIIIVGIGSIIGVMVGSKIAENVINEAYKNVKEQLSTTGRMFSTAYSFAFASRFDKTVDVPFELPIFIVVSIVIMSVVMGSIGLFFTLKRKPIDLLTSKER